MNMKFYYTCGHTMQTYAMFLDGYISEVNKHVVQLTCTRCVLDCAEPTEAQLVPVSKTVTVE